MTNPLDQIRRQKLQDEAAEWRVRIGSGGVTDADWRALEIWLSKSADHRGAFAAADELWNALDSHRDAVRARFGEGIDHERVSVAALRPGLRTFISAIAATIVVAVLAYIYWPSSAQTYRTAKGETRNVVLADNTTIYLNTDSILSIYLTRAERRVTMREGEAMFDVAKDPGRPFIITVGDRQIRVVGTQFDVLHYDGRVRVSVLRGVVAVAPVSGAGPPVTLEVGQELAHQEGTSQTTIRAIDIVEAASWRNGRLVYRDTPLQQVAADLDRYFQTPIMVDEKARSIRFSGVLVLDSEDQIIQRLQSFLPITAAKSGGKITLRSRN